jgi:hypothetical protein
MRDELWHISGPLIFHLWPLIQKAFEQVPPPSEKWLYYAYDTHEYHGEHAGFSSSSSSSSTHPTSLGKQETYPKNKGRLLIRSRYWDAPMKEHDPSLKPVTI